MNGKRKEGVKNMRCVFGITLARYHGQQEKTKKLPQSGLLDPEQITICQFVTGLRQMLMKHSIAMTDRRRIYVINV